MTERMEPEDDRPRFRIMRRFGPFEYGALDFGIVVIGVVLLTMLTISDAFL